jgi:hypothetical protein
VDHLSQSEGLPQIEIHLVEDPSLGRGISKWSYGGVLRKSIRNIPVDINKNKYGYDYEGILIPFRQLRKVPKATIFVPDDFDRKRGGFMIQNCEWIMECEEPYGTILAAGPYCSDDVTQRYLDSTYVSFEDSLDLLPGRTAGMLRLHRFSTWYDSNGKSTYLEELERISSNVKIKLHMLKERYLLMLVFYPSYPVLTVIQRIRKPLDMPLSRRFPTFALENPWDENRLRRYYRRYYGRYYRQYARDIGSQELEEIWRFKPVLIDYYRESGVPPQSVSLSKYYSQIENGLNF